MNIVSHLNLVREVMGGWDEYWRSKNCAPPPLVAYKPTISGGVLMLAPLPAPWVRDFVSAQDTHPEIAYETQGETLTEGSNQFLGSWAAFSAIHRSSIPTPKGRPVLPLALTRPQKR